MLFVTAVIEKINYQSYSQQLAFFFSILINLVRIIN